MAQDKKSFLLYADVYATVKHLTDKQAGELFKLILSYVNDENPTTNSPLIKIAFEPIKQQLKRDLIKYESRAERSRTNGLKGGRPKKPKKLRPRRLKRDQRAMPLIGPSPRSRNNTVPALS